MYEAIVIAGFGGQGVLFAGQLLAYAGLAEGRNVTWIPSYGPEMRGGTAHCTIVISDDEIGSPLVRRPTAAVVLNQPSMARYAALVQPGGVLVLDSALIAGRAERPDLHEIALPAKDIAAELGDPQIANMVLLGALIGATGVVQPATLAQMLDAHLSQRRRAALEANKQALQRGLAVAEQRQPVAVPA
jgi:2-oxoglutarate ferredoxin oxidoreductase subunit gamma